MAFGLSETDSISVSDQAKRLIDHNPRGGDMIDFAPHEAQRFKERSTVERVNARLKGDFGAGRINVRGPVKVMAHLMFAVLVLAAD